MAPGCVASLVPSKDVDELWLLQKRLLLHVARCDEFVIGCKLDAEGMEWTLHNLGDLHAN